MFSQLIGNERVKASLAQLLKNGRVPNSLLFAGPDGVGKKRFAFELARALVCKSLEERPCGKCSACDRVRPFTPAPSDKKDDYKKVFFDQHPDVGVIVPFNRNLLVDTIRAFEKEAHFQPFEAEARVFILNDAEKMNDEASNALLKTLEEPAPTTFIILITSRPDALLSTIRSRCQTIRFAPVPHAELAEILEEKRSMNSGDAKLSARIANGSVGNAMSIDLDRYRSMRAIQMDAVEKAFIKGDRPALLRISEQLNDAKNKDFYEENLAILESIIRDMWLIDSGGQDDQVRNLDEIERLRSLAIQVTVNDLECALREIESLRQLLAVNINRKIATDALFMKIGA